MTAFEEETVCQGSTLVASFVALHLQVNLVSVSHNGWVQVHIVTNFKSVMDCSVAVRPFPLNDSSKKKKG